MDADPRDDIAASQRALTLRALGTGAVLAGLLSLCNVYSGLKIGWGFNMSITSALLAFAVWNGLASLGIGARMGLHENMVNQTGASAGANISSAGLVAPVPALAFLTGQTLPLGWLIVWVLVVAWVGVVVGIGLRRPMIVEEDLPFPLGRATAETVREMYARGAEAMARVKGLLSGAGVAGLVKLAVSVFAIGKAGVPGAITLSSGAVVSLRSLTFAFDPSFFLFAVGFLTKPKVGFSMLLGAVVGFGVLTPAAMDAGHVATGPEGKMWFRTINEFLLWPGVSMMVVSALTAFVFMVPSLLRAFRPRRGPAAADAEDDPVSGRSFMTAFLVVGALAVALQVYLFSIGLVAAALGVLLTFLLAIVAGRVSGETGITPVGPMGKVTQLAFGLIAPGQAAANLMTANVTGGAASQVGDMLHDLKAGYLVGSAPRHQFIAQAVGVIGGAVVGSTIYLLLIPDPTTQLFTEQWPAPAAAQWRGVAELMVQGIESLPEGALTAAIGAGGVALLLSLVERLAPSRVEAYVPSASAAGLAMVIPGYYAISIAIGTLVFMALSRVAPKWTARFAVVIASGLIAGESLMGIGVALVRMANS